MSDILNQGGFGCIYYPGLSCKGQPTTNKKLVSKLQPNDFNARNEKNIGNLIKQISDYKMFFIPAQKGCSISIQTLDPTIVNNCNTINKAHSNEMLLLDLDYEQSISLKDIISPVLSIIEKKNKFVKLLETYKYLLSSIKNLLTIHIVHFDINLQNIIFSVGKNVPLIIDFGKSIPMKQITIENVNMWFYDYIPNNYLWPPEVHLLCYAIKYGDANITIDVTDKIAYDCISNNVALTVFSESLREKVIESCKNSLSKYANKPLHQIIDSVLQDYETWDNYALSILYLTIIKNIFPKGFKYNMFLISFTQLLLVNVSPNTEKRQTIDKTIRDSGTIFYTESSVDSFSKLVEDLF